MTAALVVDALLEDVEGGRHREYRLAVLHGDHPAGGEGASVPDPLDVVDDRDGRVSWADEVGVQGVHVTSLWHGTARGDERLGGDLTAEHPLDALFGAAPAEDVELDLLQVEQVEQLLERFVHGGVSFYGESHPNLV
ncbi:hypothetical protein FHR33_006565 [Nonomuraea dietziae]|uniref:Uncharacterized protein n=1 Tax=Nonomuraea dietziae TaxID=65515 RepID=A0A7W5VFT1_9ACTN|nr:hypothetical protein [Nonomuraea dietziae]